MQQEYTREQILLDLNPKDEERVLLERLDLKNCPRHIAFIMDGNGRWAKQRNRPRTFGHKAGVDSVHAMVDACAKLPVEVVTFYAFSTENWRRSEQEVTALMKLFSASLIKYVDDLEDQGVFINWIGDLSRMGEGIRQEFEDARIRTQGGRRVQMNLCLNYSGRADLVHAFQALAHRVKSGQLSPEAIDEEVIASSLGTAGLPEPELLIRTSGEMRLSNFLLWELAYSEFYFAGVHWPDFRLKHLLEALLEYQGRQRRFGSA